MNTLIISNRLSKTPDNSDVELYSWTYERPSAANYRNVILDLYFGPPNADGYVRLERSDQHFYEIGSEIVRCLGARGIVIALLGPVAVSYRSLRGREDQQNTLALKHDSVATYDDKYKREHETSYDWLDQGFLKDTRLDALYKKRSHGIVVLAKWEGVERYFAEAKEFWFPIQGPEIYESATKATLTYRVEENERWGYVGNTCQREAWILAVSRHTEEPVAIATNYLGKPGLLVLAPPFDIGETYKTGLEQSPKIERLLVEFAESIREQIQRLEKIDVPDWAKIHRAPRAAQIVRQIEQYNTKMESLNTELIPYDDMLYLLCGKGEELDQQVQKLFDAPEHGLQVEPTPKGSSLDLFVTDKLGRSLAIEVTGTKGKLTKGDQHWADFLAYEPDHYEKNQSGRIERMVFVVNTQCELPLEKRTRKDDITPPVINLAKDHHICIIRSCDLYQLWLETQGGMPLQKVFDSLFDCEGIYDFARRSDS